MVLPLRLRAVRFVALGVATVGFVFAPLFHGMGLCVAAGIEASADHALPEMAAGA